MKFDKYEKLGAYHWDAYADESSEYHHHVNHVVQWLAGENNILDVGAGDGLICSKIGAKVGIESNETAVRLADEKGVNVWQGDAEKMVFQSGEFGAVFLGDVIEHLAKPEKALSEIHRVLSDGGRLYVVWPADGVKDPYAIKHYTSDEVYELVVGAGFTQSTVGHTIGSRTYAKFIKQANHANDTKGKTSGLGRGKKSV